ncbi:MFS alpha-glucoside transporter [Aspergillus cavernicola]|uniref:MFS alpha-glucoside transporter n=1 Tax=Aspergillus cavernicola TaxID=176166 RepID=A0ABR4IUF8_9EURO
MASKTEHHPIHDKKDDLIHETIQRTPTIAEGKVDSVNRSRNATAVEHSMTLIDACRGFWPAILWSCMFSLGVVMAGFDPQLVGSLIAIPEFQRDFGVQTKDGDWDIQAKWQSAFNLTSPLGAVFGSYMIGWPLDRYGRRWTMAGCCVVSIIAVAIQVSAQNKAQILVAELVNGLVVGAYPVVAPTYISEVTPVILRGIVAASVNFNFVLGQLICSLILLGTQGRSDRWAYDIPFACQWSFPIIILACLFYAPESPWWLIRQDRKADARHALQRLTTETVNVDDLLAHVEITTQMEYELESQSSFLDMFKGTDLRRTIISSMVYCIQVFSGTGLVINYCVYFFQLAGLADGVSFRMGCGVLGVGLLATVLSWGLIHYFGRRILYMGGLISLTVVLLLIGLLDVQPSYDTNSALRWVESAMMLLWNFVYDLTIGAVCFVIMCEVSSARLRGKTIAFASAAQFLANFVAVVGIPYAINPSNGNMRGKLAFVYLGICIPCITYCWFCLPETKGRTFEELDLMFERGVPTRKFGTYVFEDEVHNANVPRRVSENTV